MPRMDVAPRPFRWLGWSSFSGSGDAVSEAQEQAALFKWSRACWVRYPELRWMHASANGGSRSSIIEGANLKRQGVTSGVWDVFLPAARPPYHGLWIELKKPASPGKPAGTMSDKQQEFGCAMSLAGYMTHASWGWDSARQAIINYLELPK